MFIQYIEEEKGTLICSEKSWELFMKEVLKNIEYNSNTSAQHPICNYEDDDIV